MSDGQFWFLVVYGVLSAVGLWIWEKRPYRPPPYPMSIIYAKRWHEDFWAVVWLVGLIGGITLALIG